MASPDQVRQAKQVDAELRVLGDAYEKLSGSLAVEDFMAWLASQRDQRHAIATGEMDNATRKALYLQEAHVYGTVLMYLQSKCTGDTQAQK